MASKRTLGFSRRVLRRKFRAGMTGRTYRDKEVVFSQGDIADAVFYIQSGTVKLTVVSTRRKKAIIAFLQRGSFFGEGCLGGQALRICTARSIGPSNITRLQKESTVRTLKRDPRFATLFVEYLLSQRAHQAHYRQKNGSPHRSPLKPGISVSPRPWRFRSSHRPTFEGP